MSRVLLLAGVVGVVVLSVTWAGDERGDEQKRLALENELRLRLRQLGAGYPEIVSLRERVDQLAKDIGKEICPNAVLVVILKNGGAALKEARVRSLGGRPFVVGVEVEDGTKLVRPTFPGKVLWIPMDEVRQMIEMAEPKRNQD